MFIGPQDFLPKLRSFLLPRLMETLGIPLGGDEEAQQQAEGILFHNDRLFKHNLFKVNYTTYDIRRDRDVVNPKTPQRDIMGLLSPESGGHPFWYARVLGVYHANVVYVGPGMLDYRSHRMEFLWVRHFEVVHDAPIGWSALDRVRFLPMVRRDQISQGKPQAFGFIDPSHVLRACHIVPASASGRLHPDGIAMSKHAQDGKDYIGYDVNRFLVSPICLNISSKSWIPLDLPIGTCSCGTIGV